MPISGSSSRSSAIRCSAERPRSPNASRSPRTRRTVLVGRDPGQRRAARRVQHQAGVAGQVGDLARSRSRRRGRAARRRRAGRPSRPRPRARPCRSSRSLVADRVHAVLVGRQADRGRLDPQRHVLGDQGDVASLGGQVERDGEDARVVAVDAEAGRQRRQVGVVELDVQRAAVVADRDGRVEPAVLDAQLVEHPQRLPGEPAQLGVVPLALQLADDDQRQHHLVLGEAAERARVGEQDRGVEDEGSQPEYGVGDSIGHGCSSRGIERGTTRSATGRRATVGCSCRDLGSHGGTHQTSPVRAERYVRWRVHRRADAPRDSSARRNRRRGAGRWSAGFGRPLRIGAPLRPRAGIERRSRRPARCSASRSWQAVTPDPQ